MNISDFLHIGTSGFSYKHWRGVFYPDQLTSKDRLRYYSEFFNTVELNTTFYALPKKEVVSSWYEQTPEEFKFILKGPRLITHYKKLKSIEETLSSFFERVAPLRHKLDLIFWQFPPNLLLEEKYYFSFVKELNQYPYRFAYEFRNQTFFKDSVYDLLSNYNNSIVLSDWPFNIKLENQFKSNVIEQRPDIVIPHTSNFIYLRRHGPGAIYSSSYPNVDLLNDAASIKNWISEGNQVYLFFNNDVAGYAVQNALTLKSLLEED